MKITPIVKWPRVVRWTLGPFIYVFVLVPMALIGIAQQALSAAWEEIDGSEGWKLIAAGFYAIFYGDIPDDGDDV